MSTVIAEDTLRVVYDYDCCVRVQYAVTSQTCKCMTTRMNAVHDCYACYSAYAYAVWNSSYVYIDRTIAQTQEHRNNLL